MNKQMRGISGHKTGLGMLVSRPMKPPRLNESQSSASLSPEEDPNSLPAEYTIAAASENSGQASADAEWDQQREQIIQL